MTERLHFHFSLSCIGEGNGNPLQCSCLESPWTGGAWWAAMSGVAQSRTWLKRLSSSSSRRGVKCHRDRETDKAPSVSPKKKSFLAEIWVSSNVFPQKRWVYFHEIEYFIKFFSSKGNSISQIFITYIWQLRHSVSTVRGGVYKINKTFSPAPYL